MKTHVRLAAAAATLAALVGATLQAPAEARSTAGVRASAAVAPVRIATYNTQVGRSVADFGAGVLPLAQRADVIGLQEMNGYEKDAVLASLGESGWARYAVRPALQTPVAWRTDRFTFVSGRPAKISDPTYLGGELKGRNPMEKARYVTVVRLVDKVTGRRISVINVHMIQGAIKGGRPVPNKPRLWRLYKRGLLNLASLTASEKRWGRVFVLGDFNSGWVADHKRKLKRLPVRTFGRLGMKSMWATSRPSGNLGTHNDALIDQVFTDMRASGTQIQFDLAGHSDHRPAIAYYPTT